MSDVTVFRTWDEPLADMALDFLREAGIMAVKVGDVPRSVLPFTVDGLGEIEIRVPAADRIPAAEIIAVRFSDDPAASSEQDAQENDYD